MQQKCLENTWKTKKSRSMNHQMNTFMYFTRISSPFHSIVLMTFRMHSVQLHCDAFKSLRAWKFKKFVYNVWVCQYHCFTWTYQPMTYSCVNILTLTQIKPMFHFWTPENVWKLYYFLKFSGGKNKTLSWYRLRTYLMLLSHCKPRC